MIKKFIFNVIILIIPVILIHAILLFLVPKDNNAYLCEYNKKVDLIKTTPSSRLIFMGSSTLAFGIDSRQISDSLGLNVINLGLNAGIGARYYLDDYSQYIKKGDIVVLSPSYIVDFILGGYGLPETLPDLMVSTNWRNFDRLGYRQLRSVLEGIPFFCYRNLVRLIKAPVEGWETKKREDVFLYVADGFNQFGDETSHWTIPEKAKTRPVKDINQVKRIEVDKDFLGFLRHKIVEYENKGAIVLIMPEICSQNHFFTSNPLQIEKELKESGMNFCFNPKELVFDNSYGYGKWGNGHFNRAGVTVVSNKIALLLKNVVNGKTGEIIQQ